MYLLGVESSMYLQIQNYIVLDNYISFFVCMLFLDGNIQMNDSYMRYYLILMNMYS